MSARPQSRQHAPATATILPPGPPPPEQDWEPGRPVRVPLASRRMTRWSMVTGATLTAMAYYGGYSPGSGLAGSFIAGVVTLATACLTVLVLVITVRHGFHPGRRYAGVLVRRGAMAGRDHATAWWQDRQDRQARTSAAEAAPPQAAAGPGTEEMNERVWPARRVPRPPARPVAGRAPAHWQRAASLVADMDPDKGAVFTDALRGEGTGLTGYADAVETLRSVMVDQYGMDAEALRVLEEAEEALGAAAAKFPQAAQYVESYYGLIREHHEEGRKMVHDGHFWEE